MTEAITEPRGASVSEEMADEPIRVALAGMPNSGKTSLFNTLTGGRQKVGNYPGVTVERKEGALLGSSGRRITILDLPGTYSLDACSLDEAVTRDVLLGAIPAESVPELLVIVADAANLERSLGLVLELKSLGRNTVLALNMMDLARDRGIELDLDALSSELGIPVIPTVAVKKSGTRELVSKIEEAGKLAARTNASPKAWVRPTPEEIRTRFAESDRILRLCLKRASAPSLWTDRLDRVALHPIWGSLLLFAILALVFQSIFSWASMPADAIEAGIAALGGGVASLMAEGPLRSLLVDGVIAGVGSVVVFLPQILLLFFFILLLEDSGYMSRAAFLMDRLMSRVGLHGKAFIPLLSSYACAIPGIMATRTISDRRDRLTTILIAPLTTCSARLPVYALLIAAFVPDRPVLGFLNLQGLVLLGLYVAGIAATLAMALIFRRTVFRGPKAPLLLELPTYKWPSLRSLVLGLWERARLFTRRAGTVILTLSILVWFLSSYPKPPVEAPVGESRPEISYSYAGTIGRAIEPLMAPLGFDWRISIAMIPSFAAREVMVSALATVYSIEKSAEDEEGAQALGERIRNEFGLPVAISLLIWYVLACQCLSTLAVTRRETNSWRWPAFMLFYMTALAYLGAFIAYRTSLWLGL